MGACASYARKWVALLCGGTRPSPTAVASEKRSTLFDKLADRACRHAVSTERVEPIRPKGRSAVISPARLVASLTLALSLLCVAPRPAHAGYDTLKRSLGNLFFAPFDLMLSPVVAGKTVYTHLRDIEDTKAVRIAYTVPGYFWITAVQAASAGIRAATGCLEILPGIALLPFPGTEMTPLFDPVEKADALVDFPNPAVNVKFGVDYTSPPS